LSEIVAARTVCRASTPTPTPLPRTHWLSLARAAPRACDHGVLRTAVPGVARPGRSGGAARGVRRPRLSEGAGQVPQLGPGARADAQPRPPVQVDDLMVPWSRHRHLRLTLTPTTCAKHCGCTHVTAHMVPFRACVGTTASFSSSPTRTLILWVLCAGAAVSQLRATSGARSLSHRAVARRAAGRAAAAKGAVVTRRAKARARRARCCAWVRGCTARPRRTRGTSRRRASQPWRGCVTSISARRYD